MKTYTTEEAASAVKISRATLQVWIAAGKISGPPVQIVEGKAVRLWKSEDIARLRTVKASIYRKGRGRRPKKGRSR